MPTINYAYPAAFNPATYRPVFDPVGTVSANRVTGEKHTVTASNARDFHFLVPLFAPFFAFPGALSVVFQPTTGTARTLVEGVDYNLAFQFIGASRACAKPVYGGITLLNTTLAGVFTLAYRTLGGNWTLNQTEINRILADAVVNPRVTAWEQVIERPVLFPVIDHEWNLTDMVGAREVERAIQEIGDAIAIKPAGTNGALGVHTTDFTNPHQVTKLQVGLGNVQNYPIASSAEATEGTAANRYMTPAGVSALVASRLDDAGDAGAAHMQNKLNPHAVTKQQVGLGNADNTTDLLKPVSTATGNALALKANLDSPTFSGTPKAPTAAAGTSDERLATTEFVAEMKAALTKADVGLSNVQNYGMANETDVSNALQDFSDVFNTWTRYSHSGSVQPSAPDEINSWSYDAASDSISCLVNSVTNIGFVSTQSFDDYVFEAEVSSDDRDDDVIGIVIGFVVVGGVEYTLTAQRNLNSQGATFNVVYNGGLAGAKVLGSNMGGMSSNPYQTGQTVAETGVADAGSGWQGKTARIRAVRYGNIITVSTSALNSANILASTEITINLNSDPLLTKFKTNPKIGFFCQSQRNSSWKFISSPWARNDRYMTPELTASALQKKSLNYYNKAETLELLSDLASSEEGNLLQQLDDGLYLGSVAPDDVRELYVDSSALGNDNNAGTSAAPMKTLRAALARGAPGLDRTIYVREEQTHYVDPAFPAVFRGGNWVVLPYGTRTDALPPVNGDWKYAQSAASTLAAKIVCKNMIDSGDAAVNGVFQYGTGMYMTDDAKITVCAMNFTCGSPNAGGAPISSYDGSFHHAESSGVWYMRNCTIHMPHASSRFYSSGKRAPATCILGAVRFTGLGKFAACNSKLFSLDWWGEQFMGANGMTTTGFRSYLDIAAPITRHYGDFTTNLAPAPAELTLAQASVMKLDSGHIIQTGTGVSATGNGDTVVFPITFPNGVISITVTEANATGWGVGCDPTVYGWSPKNTSGFYIYAARIADSGQIYQPGLSYAYTAIGY